MGSRRGDAEESADESGGAGMPVEPEPGGGAHPLVDAVTSIAGTLAQVADADPVYLREGDKREVAAQLASCCEQLEGLRLAVLGASPEVAYAHGARSPGAWGAHLALRDPAAGRADQRLVDGLERYHQVAAALRYGRLSRDHAEVSVRALDRLPARVGPETLQRAEETLVHHAGDCTPRQLRLLGRRILELVAPEVAEDEERRRLEDEEKHARESTWLSLRDVGDGTTAVSGLVPTPAAHQLRALLAAYTSPRRDHHEDSREGEYHRGREHGASGDAGDGDGATAGTFADQAVCGAGARRTTLRRDPATGERLPHDRLLGEAFCSLLEHVPTDRLPAHGSSAATVVITLSWDQLRDQVGAATLSGVDDGTEQITARQARRLACEAGLVPAVLGGDGEVLDLGRSTRLFTAAQRRAKQHATPVCEAAGCDMPAPWCEMHHDQPWTLDGATDLENAVQLCAFHHHRTHDHDFTHDRMPNGDIRYHRRI